MKVSVNKPELLLCFKTSTFNMGTMNIATSSSNNLFTRYMLQDGMLWYSIQCMEVKNNKFIIRSSTDNCTQDFD